MKMKQAVAGLALAAALVVPASAADVLSVNGQNLWSQAQARLVEEGTTYVSLRAVANVLSPDAAVTWEDGTAWVRGAGLTLSAKPGEQWLTVNGRALYIPHGVRLEKGSTLVPIRALARALGGEVEWSAGKGVMLTPGSGRPEKQPYTQEDLYWMARIISAESRGEPLLGKLAVGTVVLNRVRSDEFPNTVREVIFDRKWGVQFTPVANGTVYDEPTQESLLAAKLVLDGARAAGNSLYFIAPELTDNHWTMENRTYVTTIGCHWFYEEHPKQFPSYVRQPERKCIVCTIAGPLSKRGSAILLASKGCKTVLNKLQCGYNLRTNCN